MHDLFQDRTSPRRIEMQGADVVLHPAPDIGIDPDVALRRLVAETDWQQRSIRIQGREIPQPRLIAWHGEADYAYSGIRMKRDPMTSLLELLRERVEALTGARFNSVLLNLYRAERGGRDSIGMHSDDEPELGRDPTIAALSLGGERVFDMRRADGTGRTVHVPLTHGSLLVMAGATQRNWKHGIAKANSQSRDRISLTFRLTRPRG